MLGVTSKSHVLTVEGSLGFTTTMMTAGGIPGHLGRTAPIATKNLSGKKCGRLSVFTSKAVSRLFSKKGHIYMWPLNLLTRLE